MGRVKLKIKRLESHNNRQATYSKRRNGILKKAKELSILCDIGLILVMFSPTGKPTIFRSEQRNAEEVIAKYAQLTPQERHKRKLDSLEALKKTFKNLDHDVNIQDFMGRSNRSIGEMSQQVSMLKAQITEIHQKLSCWNYLEKVDNIDHLRQMEDSLSETLNRIRLQKENFIKHEPLTSMGCSSQITNAMHLPIMTGGVPQTDQLSSWTSNNDKTQLSQASNNDKTQFSWDSNSDNQRIMWSGEPSYVSHRDGECSSDHGIATYLGFMENPTQIETQYTDGFPSDLSSTVSLSQQHDELYSYLHPYSVLDLPDQVKKLNPTDTTMNLEGSPLDYQLNANFEFTKPTYEDTHHGWNSLHDPINMPMFDGNTFSEQHY